MATSSGSRRKAEAGTLVIEEPPRKVLRLRPSLDESWDISALDINDVVSVQQLSRIERRVHKITDINSLLVSLTDKLKVAKTTMIKTKIVQLLRTIVANHKVDCTFIAQEITTLLSRTESHQFKTELLSLCCSVCCSLRSDSKHFTGLMNIAKESLKDRTSAVRSSAILLMGDVIKYGTGAGLPFEDTLGMQLIIIDFIKDPEPRVRSVALETLSDLHSSGRSLENTVYEHASQALSDDYERVRTASLRLVSTLAVHSPERLITMKSNATQSIPMLDDGFAKVCDAINDVSFIVRTQAARLMANFVGVSQGFLEQTLDKKLMSNMRRKQSGHERQREFYQSGEWSSGKRFADDAPKESVNEESVSLISMGACGAFVHALEDEFMEVREAAVESMCVLAQSNAAYARQTQDFLVDMFNDEIEEVRLQAIRCLCKIAQHLCLRDDQVEIISGVLKDFGGDIRTGIHRLIQACKIATHSGLRDMILALLDNMRKYPQDKRSIFRVMKDLGLNHPGLMSPLLPELLSVDPHFEMAEPNMDDDCYVAVMIAVYNAAYRESSLISLFPSHTERHYRFHRGSLPNLVPIVEELEHDSMIGSLQIEIDEASPGHLVADIEKQLTRADNLADENSAARSQLLVLCLRDLKHINNREGTENLAKVNYLSDYIKCILLFHKIQSYSKDGADKLVLSLSQQVVTLCERLLNLYNNVPSETSDIVRQFQLLALTVCLAKKMETNFAQADEFKLYLEQLTKIKRQLSRNGKHLLSVTRLLDSQETLEAGNWSILQSAAADMDLTTLPLPQDLSDTINTIQCELDVPVTRSDTPKRFTAGLAVCLPINAELRHLKPGSQLCIKVRLPDQSEVICPVKACQVTDCESDQSERTLSTRVVFSHGHWSESSYVEVGVLLRTDSLSDMIEICPPRRVYITTRLEKKAHVGNIM